jgi:acetylornithine deacetylase/succinyl-diaminopimelate desuccinylase family protein
MADAADSTRLCALLERLVAFDTQNPPGREAEAAGFLVSALQALGFSTELQTVADGRANAIARLSNGAGPTLAFNSHIDTVPVGAGWSSDPLRLIDRDGRLQGRGACDAKGAIAAMVEAARLLAARRDDWSGTLLLTFVADEEIDGTGSKRVTSDAKAKQTPIDAVIIGEPTSNQVHAAHKGVLRPLLRVSGQTAHSSRPDLGVNAIQKAGQLLSLLDAEDRKLRTRHHALVGPATLTVTRISGGVADNVVPDACEIVIDRRLLPGEEAETALDELQQLLTTARRDHDISAEVVRIRSVAGAAETALSATIVQRSLAAASAHGGQQREPAGFTGGCDLVHFRAIGSEGVILGPGSLEQAHKPDEYVPKAELVQAALIYRDIALAMLRP